MYTITQLAKRYGYSRPHVVYVLRKAGIKHAHRAGITRIYLDSQLPAIEKALDVVRHRTYSED